MRRATRIACAGESLRCTSTRMSTSGPTASRTARTRSTAVCSSFLSMMLRQGPGKGSNLSAGEPARNHRGGPFGKLLRTLSGIVPASPAIGVDPDPGPAGAAEQVVDGLVQRFAHNIPHGLFDGADGGVEIHRASLAREVRIRHVREVLDIERKTVRSGSVPVLPREPECSGPCRAGCRARPIRGCPRRFPV